MLLRWRIMKSVTHQGRKRLTAAVAQFKQNELNIKHIPPSAAAEDTDLNCSR